MKPVYGSPFPNQGQELLLKACIFDDDKMLQNYHQWGKSVNFETEVEHASFRQLPLLYQNLNQHGVDDHLMPRLKGMYRKSWSANHILFFKTGKVLQLLHEANIATLVLKGIALSVLAYQNYAVRPMADMDIMIPAAKAKHTFELLKENGWESYDEIHDNYNLANNKSITLVNEDKTELDLHWHPFDECLGLMKENDFWDRAVPMEVSGQKTLALCPADELLLTFVHGLMPNPEPPIRWIADAMYIINSKHLIVDWQRLIDYAKKYSVIIQVKIALKYLTETFDAMVPTEVSKNVSIIKPTFADKLVYKKKGVFVYHPSFKKLFTAYITFLKNPSYKGMISKHMGFIKYIRERSKGKPHFKIMIHYISILTKSRGKK